jgi:hypothetical protein
MADAREAWEEVGDAFESLGLKLKLHVEESTGATTDGVKQALSTFVDTMRGAVQALGDAANDPAVKEDAKRVGSAVTKAISATFDEVGESLRRS